MTRATRRCAARVAPHRRPGPLGADELACKPDSVPRRRNSPVAAATIHLRHPSPDASRGLPAGSGEQPSSACAAAPLARRRGAASWPCFGWGLPSHPGHPGCWCALTAPFHPYRRPQTSGTAAVCFLWHCPASHLGLPLAITLLCEVRTFLDPPTGAPRPPGQLVRGAQPTRSCGKPASAFRSGTPPGRRRTRPDR